MKRTGIISLVTIFIAAVVATVWWSKTTCPTVGLTRTETAPLPQSTLTSTPPAPKHETKPKAEAMKEALTVLNQQPIEFYGRVVDQYDSPVPGAMVLAQVIYNTGPTSGVLKSETITNNSGKFEFRGLQGRTLDLNIVKSGYHFMPEGDGFDYTKLVSEQRRHHPDPEKPVILKMWKSQGAAPRLISKTKTVDLPCDGTPVRLDLVTSEITSAAGDVIITLKHGTQPPGRSVTRYDWTAELVAVDGGLREEPARLTNMFEAPADGYVPSVVINMPVSAVDWSRTYSRNFYMKTRGNIHSRVGIDIHTIPSGGSSYVSLTWWLNPEPESRNLEDGQARVNK